ncbi:MAG: DinB family protein [Terriglobales bacterium]
MTAQAETATATAARSYTELLNHDEQETGQWHEWFRRHPEALDAKMELAMMHDVRGVLFHIFLVELRYAERLLEQPETAPDALPKQTADELFGIAATARKKFREFMARATEADWNKAISFQTLSAGMISASKRKCFVHAFLHGMRHWAQLATALRQQGMKTDWGHDILFSKAMQ